MHFNTLYIYVCTLVLTFCSIMPAYSDDTIDVDSVVVDTVAIDTVPRPWNEVVAGKLQQLVTSDITKTSQLGLMVYDLEADSAIFCYNHLQTLRPASTMKLITAIAALDKLGGSYRFTTDLRFTGNIVGKVLHGDLYCVGGFDPRFNNDDLNAFVESVRRLGIDTIMGNIYADKSMKDSATLGEGWCWDDDNPVLSPLLISRKDNFLSRFAQKLVDDGVVIIDADSTDRAYRFINSPRDYVRRKPAGTFSVTSRFHTFEQILMRMLKDSDNLYAESMFYQLAASSGAHPATAADARKAINKLVSKIGLQPQSYQIADGSGLSLYNYLSPELEVMFLRYAYLNDNIYPHLLHALPIAGLDGTLKSRMKKSPAFENVRAKTGTLTCVNSLAGYCKASNGHLLCFSIMNQGVLNSSRARSFQDQVCRVLCE